MSWGERSCTMRRCTGATAEKCCVDCPEYEHDGKTMPDSVHKDPFTRILFETGLRGMLRKRTAEERGGKSYGGMNRHERRRAAAMARKSKR